MRTLRRNWTKLAGAVALAGMAVVAVYACITSWGQTLPGLSIAMTNSNSAVSLVVTNGTNMGKYNIFWREFLDTNHDWTLLTNGGAGITNFLFGIGDTTSGYFEARNNTNTTPFVLNLTIVAPASGANIQ
jgi:hypothetical protein